MKIYANGRQSGKTYRLIQWVKNGKKTDSYPGWSRILLCHSLDEAQRIRTQYDLDYRQVFSVSEWQRARKGHEPVEVALDNADLVLAMLLDQRPAYISMTGTVE